MSALRAQLWAKARTARHGVASVRGESKLKVAFVSLAAVGLWVGAFALFRAGFRWLDLLGGPLGSDALTEALMGRLLATLALALLIMLVVSNVLMAFATLYRARDEMSFLIHRPVDPTALFLGRFTEVVVFSSWALAYLGSPALLAFGMARDAPWTFYAALGTFYVPFVTIPAAVGTMVAMILVAVLAPRRRVAGVAAALGVVVVLVTALRAPLMLPDFDTVTSLSALTETLGRAQSSLVPSTWLARGVLAAAAGDTPEALFFLLLLIANALLLVWIATHVAQRWLMPGWFALAGRGGATNRRGGALDQLVGVVRWLPQPVRALTEKDLKLFWRDPAQWSQFLLFFGILALYVANLRSTGNTYAHEPWRSWIALLNLAACLLVLATLTTRFVFPLISLEGRRFWILGLAPLSRRRIAWQKLGLSVASTSVFTVGLVGLSAWQLRLDGLTFALSAATVLAATAALSGLAVGLGCLYPNFNEDNPARIVSGLGGTLNFLLSLLYVVMVAGLLTLALKGEQLLPILEAEGIPIATIAMGAIALISAVTAWTPMALGIRNLERIEI